MRTNQKWWPALLLAAVLAAPFAGAAQAQTTSTTAVNKFEILAVDGNNLVVRNEKGTHEYVVPDDFRFTVDGKKLSVKELKPGMKGTATVTTKTTLTPVTVTEIKEGTVVSATELTVNVRSADGVRRFTQSQLDDRGVQILKEGRIIRIRDLRQGDMITATIFLQSAARGTDGNGGAGHTGPGCARSCCTHASRNPRSDAGCSGRTIGCGTAGQPSARKSRARAASGNGGNALALVHPDCGCAGAAVVLRCAQEGKALSRSHHR